MGPVAASPREAARRTGTVVLLTAVPPLALECVVRRDLGARRRHPGRAAAVASAHPGGEPPMAAAARDGNGAGRGALLRCAEPLVWRSPGRRRLVLDGWQGGAHVGQRLLVRLAGAARGRRPARWPVDHHEAADGVTAAGHARGPGGGRSRRVCGDRWSALPRRRGAMLTQGRCGGVVRRDSGVVRRGFAPVGGRGRKPCPACAAVRGGATWICRR